MSATLTHEELHDMVPAAALEILESEDLQQVLAHVRTCSECEWLLREYRQVVATLASELPPQAMEPARAARLRARLIARAPGSPSRMASIADRWMGWAVAAGLAGVLLMHHAIHRPLEYGWLAAGALTVVLVILGGYARAQWRRLSAIRERLAALERREKRSDEP